MSPWKSHCSSAAPATNSSVPAQPQRPCDRCPPARQPHRTHTRASGAHRCRAWPGTANWTKRVTSCSWGRELYSPACRKLLLWGHLSCPQCPLPPQHIPKTEGQLARTGTSTHTHPPGQWHPAESTAQTLAPASRGLSPPNCAQGKVSSAPRPATFLSVVVGARQLVWLPWLMSLGTLQPEDSGSMVSGADCTAPSQRANLHCKSRHLSHRPVPM